MTRYVPTPEGRQYLVSATGNEKHMPFSMAPLFVKKAIKIEQLLLADLTPHPAQPPRHSEAQCQDLLSIIRETTIIDPIVVVRVGRLAAKPQDNGKYYVINGNRRLTCARLLGETMMDVIIVSDVHTESELMRLWSLFNGGGRRISGKEIFWSWASIKNENDRLKYLGHIATWNHGTANHIQKLCHHVGIEKALDYATSGRGDEAKLSPNVVTRIADLLKEAQSQSRPEFQTPSFVRKMVAWFYRHNMYREVGDTKKLMPSWGGKHPYLFDAIMNSIQSDRPFSLNSHITVDVALPVGPRKTSQIFSNGMLVVVPNC